MNSKARIKTNPSPRVLRELETDHVEGMIRSTFVTYPEEGAEVVAALTQLVQRHRPVGPHQTVFTVVDAVETFLVTGQSRSGGQYEDDEPGQLVAIHT